MSPMYCLHQLWLKTTGAAAGQLHMAMEVYAAVTMLLEMVGVMFVLYAGCYISMYACRYVGPTQKAQHGNRYLQLLCSC